MNGLFVTGIGTDVGKTIVSAALCSELELDYWKPVQAGCEPQTDTERVTTLLPEVHAWPETYRLQTPASPHWAAEIDNCTISLSDFHWPNSSKKILVEGAGGPLVPLNDYDLVIDIAVRFQLPVVLVVRHYLGSINHTLCAIEAIRKRGLTILGMVVSGEAHPSSEKVICGISNLEIIARVAEFSETYNHKNHWQWIKKIK